MSFTKNSIFGTNRDPCLACSWSTPPLASPHPNDAPSPYVSLLMSSSALLGGKGKKIRIYEEYSKKICYSYTERHSESMLCPPSQPYAFWTSDSSVT